MVGSRLWGGRHRNIATMVMSGSGGLLTFHRVRNQYGARAGAFDGQASPAWRRPAAAVTKRWGEEEGRRS